MKKISLFAVLAMISSTGFAASGSSMPSGGPVGFDDSQGSREMGPGGPHGGGMMDNLTDTQKECVAAYGCSEMEKPDESQKPNEGQKPAEMTDEQKAKMEERQECMQEAFESCGIEMPEMPEMSEDGSQGSQQGNRQVVTRGVSQR